MCVCLHMHLCVCLCVELCVCMYICMCVLFTHHDLFPTNFFSLAAGTVKAILHVCGLLQIIHVWPNLLALYPSANQSLSYSLLFFCLRELVSRSVM